MANNLIQIKRSTSNASIPALLPGELAFTQAGNTFYVGAPDGSSGNIRIGGEARAVASCDNISDCMFTTGPAFSRKVIASQQP